MFYYICLQYISVVHKKRQSFFCFVLLLYNLDVVLVYKAWNSENQLPSCNQHRHQFHIVLNLYREKNMYYVIPIWWIFFMHLSTWNSFFSPEVLMKVPKTDKQTKKSLSHLCLNMISGLLVLLFAFALFLYPCAFVCSIKTSGRVSLAITAYLIF